jgi:hypothetical protein
MNENKKRQAHGSAIIRWLVAVAFIVAVILSGLFSGLTNTVGLFYLVFGTIAVVFMGFSRREIAAAFRQAAGRPGPPEELRRSAYFWEAAARNAWILGVLGSTMSFTIALGSESGGIEEILTRVLQAFVVTLYGLVLAVVCLVPALKLAGRAEDAPAQVRGPGMKRPILFERVIGYALFAAVLGLTIFSLIKDYPQTGPLPMAKVMLHGPAVLIVFGGAIALALFMGVGAGARGLTLGFTMTGLISLLMGLLQALSGFVHKSQPELVAALAFVISASSFALLGLALVAAPLEDREVMDGRRERPWLLSRMAWTGFPLLAFIFLLLTLIVVITPMTKPG